MKKRKEGRREAVKSDVNKTYRKIGIFPLTHFSNIILRAFFNYCMILSLFIILFVFNSLARKIKTTGLPKVLLLS